MGAASRLSATVSSGGTDERLRLIAPLRRFEDAAKLEADKLAILKQMSKDRELLIKAQEKIVKYRLETVELRAELAKTSAMFLKPEKQTASVTMKDKDGKDKTKTVVVKPLGTREAVTETKRIIDRKLHHLRQEFEVVEVKLNRQRGTNDRLRHQVNTMRREASVFDHLFDKMCAELMEAKRNTEATRASIEDAYAARDATRTEAQAVLDAMQRDRQAAKEEFDLQTLALQDADATVQRKAAPSSGVLTTEEEDLLKRKVIDTAWRIQEHKQRLSKAKAKAKAFEDATEYLKDHTGYESLDELIAQMTACEEEKFEKASAAARLISDVESLEKDIQELRDVYRERQTSNAENLQASTQEVASLQLRAAEASRTLDEDKTMVELLKAELAAVMPVVSDLFYAAGCHTVFDEAFIPSSSLRQRSFIVAKTSQESRRATAGSQFMMTLPSVEAVDDDYDDSDDSHDQHAVGAAGAAAATAAAAAAAVTDGGEGKTGSADGRGSTAEGKDDAEGIDLDGAVQVTSPAPSHAGSSGEGHSPTASHRASPSAMGGRPTISTGRESLTRRPSVYAGDTSPSKTPSSRRSLAMRMFSRIPAFRHVIDEGVNQHTLHQFMSVLDQKTAELVQFFVYLLHHGRVSPVRTPSFSSRVLDAQATGGDAAGVLEAAKAITMQNLVGPSAPSGAVAQSLTSSALLASMLNTDVAGSLVAGAGGDVDESKPLSLAEIRRQASATLGSAEFSAYRQASVDAAVELQRRTTQTRKLSRSSRQ